MEIKVPRLGETADSGSVINILVKEGDKVQKNQTILELENEKAVAPIPSTESGVVSKVHVKIGDKVSVGQTIISLGGGAGDGAKAPAASPSKTSAPQTPAQQTPAHAPAASSSAPVSQTSAGYQYHSPGGFPPPASPSLRRLAQDLGIDLTRVRGSEHGGRIVLRDLAAYIQNLQALSQTAAVPASGSVPGPAKPAPVSIDFSKWGPVTKKPVSSLRKKIAEKMHESWSAIPHVTQHDEVDVTTLSALTKKYGAAYEKKGTRLTLTAVILKACVGALKKYPVFNSSLDELSGELVLKNYYHLGVAVDTEQGLIVPVLRNVDQKNLFEISKELGEIAEKTRQRKIGLEDLKGGTFTISNLGGIGGGFFTPIINRPEVAILGVSRGVMKPAAVDKKIELRMLMPVSVSYDHRVVDGADGARFIKELGAQIAAFPEQALKDGLGSSSAKTPKSAGPAAKTKSKRGRK